MSFGERDIILSFIEKNKEYEQSKEIIEEWKKVNNIQYNPEEIYSRGQEFSSVLGAYSNFDVNLMMQNLLQHIEDNEKAGGKFAISAFTKPVDKIIPHLEAGGGKIKFKIYPQSQDILWAANIDVYSGSVWDASEKVNKDKKSELLGVSYTKYPSLRNVTTVQPNLASIVDNLAHHHNELGIALTGNNFRLEYDADIPYQTKKIIDSINKILDQKYGKLVKPEIKQKEFGTKYIAKEESAYGDFKTTVFDTEKEALDYKKSMEKYDDVVVRISKQAGIQPTQTKNNLKESIESVKSKIIRITNNEYRLTNKDNKWQVIEPGLGNTATYAEFDNIEDAKKLAKELNLNLPKEKEYIEQALINTKISALKEVAKKYPRSLIRSEVVKLYKNTDVSEKDYFFEEDELPFQLVQNNNIKPGVEELFNENPELANQVYEVLGFKTVYQGYNVLDSRDINYYTIDKKEATDYGKNIRTVVVDIKSNLLDGTSNEYYNLVNQDQKLTNKRFDLLDNTKEGLIKQEQFFKFLKKQGYNGLDFTKYSDSQYVITFSNLEITPQQKQQALQLYSQYLDTIFPDSKVKDIVYHSTDATFDKFKKQDIKLLNPNIDEGLYFSKNPNYYDKKINTYSVILNLKNFETFDHDDFIKALDASGIRKKESKENIDGFITLKHAVDDFYFSKQDFYFNNDSYLESYENVENVTRIEYTKNGELITKNEFDTAYSNLLESLKPKLVFATVFEPEQTHILGSKPDIEGFKEFVEKPEYQQKRRRSGDFNTLEYLEAKNEFFNKYRITKTVNGVKVPDFFKSFKSRAAVQKIIESAEKNGKYDALSFSISGSNEYGFKIDIRSNPLYPGNSTLSSYQQKFESNYENVYGEKPRVDLDENLTEETIVTPEEEETFVAPRLEQDNLESIREKTDMLMSIFNVHVIYDDTIDEKGKVLSPNDPLTKQYGKPVIVINTKHATTDTVFHEFAHLFIDFLGYDDPRIQEAVELLKGTKLWAETQELYSDLSKEMLAKEVLAEAMGRDANQLFTENKDKSWWTRFVDWFLRSIGRKLKTDKLNAIRVLTTEMLDSRPVNSLLAEHGYQSRRLTYSDVVKEMTPEYVSKVIKGKLETRIDYYKRKDDQKIQDHVATLEALVAKMEEYVANAKEGMFDMSEAQMKDSLNKMHLAVIKMFVEKLGGYTKETKNIDGTIDRKYIKGDIEKLQDRIEEQKGNVDILTLKKIDEFLGAFDILEDLPEMFEKNGDKQTSKDVQYLLGAIAKLKTDRIKLGINYTAKKYAHLNTFVEKQAKVKYEREYHEANRGIKRDDIYLEAMRNYINEKLEENREALNKEKEESLKGMLISTPDISGFEALLFEAGQSSSKVIQIAKIIFDQIDFAAQQMHIKRRDEFVKVFEEYDNKSENMIERYRKFLDFDANGDPTGFLKGEYKAEFYITYKKLQKELFELENQVGASDPKYKAAKEAFKTWQKQNTVKAKNGTYLPSSSWKTNFSVEKLSKSDRQAYELIKNSIEQSDKNVPFEYQKLVRSVTEKNKALFIKLPAVEKTMLERIFDGKGSEVIEDFKNNFETTEEDRELLGIEAKDTVEYENYTRVFANEKLEKDLTVPVHFRSNLAPNKMSYDLFTITLLNSNMADRVGLKLKAQLDIELLLDVVGDKTVLETQNGNLAVSAMSKMTDNVKDIILKKSAPGSSSNEYKQLKSIIEDRFYGQSEIAWIIGNVNMNKITSKLSSYTAKLGLGFNTFAGVTNVLNGKTQNFIEGVGGNYYNVKNVMEAEKEYISNIPQILNDTMSLKPSSKINLLNEMFDVLSEGGQLNHKFKDSSFFRRMMGDPSFFLSHAGEHYMQSSVMIATMKAFKVYDSKGNIIQKDGKDLSLYDAYEVIDGKLVLDSRVKSARNKSQIELDLSGKTAGLEIRNLVKAINSDLHGQYDKRQQSMAQRAIIGRMAFMYRKWVIPGALRRWRGASKINKPKDELHDFETFYRYDKQELEEGYYVTMMRFLGSVFKQIRTQSERPVLTEYERSNLRKATVEFAAILVSITAATLAKGMADDDDSESLYFAAIVFRRTYSELSVFSFPMMIPEGLKILKAPAADISTLEKSWKLVQSLMTLEEYQKGSMKGELKAKKYAGDMVPIYGQFKRVFSGELAEQSRIYFN